MDFPASFPDLIPASVSISFPVRKVKGNGKVVLVFMDCIIRIN